MEVFIFLDEIDSYVFWLKFRYNNFGILICIDNKILIVEEYVLIEGKDIF